MSARAFRSAGAVVAALFLASCAEPTRSDGIVSSSESRDRAKTDNFFAPWSGTVPTGPGLWFSSANPPAPPIGALFGRARTFFLETGSQFRPPPPPAFGSPEFIAALAEVRQISDTRTRAQ